MSQSQWWLIILSDQLWIVGLVGLYPTNYLIQRGLISGDKSLDFRHHPVLAAVSSCYSEPRADSHALRTRAPLRPKPSFDLHVLGMPPAFVLSQDQTLKFDARSLNGGITNQKPLTSRSQFLHITYSSGYVTRHTNWLSAFNDPKAP